MENTKMHSPVAPMLWPALFEATVYDPNNPAAKPDPANNVFGHYQTDLVLNPAIEEHKLFLEKLDAACEQAMDESGLSGMRKPVPYSKRDDLDENKNPTGAYRVRFKVPAGGVSRRTGSTWERSVPMFNANGELFELEGEVANGSKGRVSFEVRPYATGGVVGCSLRLAAVQFLHLEVRRPKGADADDFSGLALSDDMGAPSGAEF